ncbi:MAG TPA: LPS export ABC transporter ATP-binding protein [Thermosulfidibacter takaii]|uniref:LPS export ABC transporter ATP-binding protein n=1 Tax=Thermosulfidibacter takaii TaxID=412593 RepID=A0A7C0YDD9_9BACT|nr:MAG: LPS export ABC transporter ATP-binding protein [Aquificota bacterium]HDD53179.1 LPS export ABC transporter ATP-binding protein [Thermosulfidibacter takaii]
MKLEARNLEKSFKGRKVVKGVSLEVSQGEVVGLLGPNGAGKTTVFYMITGLIAPDAGSIHLNGEDITHLPMYKRARRGLGYLPQEPSVFRRLEVWENIMAVLELLDVPPAERKSRTDRLLADMGLERVKNSVAYTLSGGERRRVEIARALALSPAFILLDEPFAGIDPIVVEELQEVIKAMKNRGIGVVITDHNVRETLHITDRTYIIGEGEILEEGPPEVIASSPRARKIYLGEGFTL